jgi:hypothetical protein
MGLFISSSVYCRAAAAAASAGKTWPPYTTSHSSKLANAGGNKEFFAANWWKLFRKLKYFVRLVFSFILKCV